MAGHRENTRADRQPGNSREWRPLHRRAWLRIAAGATAGLGGFDGRSLPAFASDDPKDAADEAEELQRAETRARKVTNRPLLTLKSAHYQAVGDASETFIKLTLSDCEKMAADYLHHFRARGFDVKLPDRRLTVIAFRDERPS